jgi:beta-N-acetylhexosaminidase
VAARILFQEITPKGSSPVSIPGVAYDMITATTPDPDQIISLQVDENAAANKEQVTQQTTAQASEKTYNLGDNLPVRTGVILDHNGHPVPDGTVVKFLLNQQGENVTVQQIETTTVGGIAHASIKLQTEGMHEIRVTSEPAENSQILVLNISSGKSAEISAINPTPIPTEEEINEKKTPIVEEKPVEEPVKANNRVLEWLLTSLLAWSGGILFFYNSNQLKSIRNRAFISAGIIAGGLLTALWQILGFAGGATRSGFSGYLDILFTTLMVKLFSGWYCISTFRSFPIITDRITS